MSGHTPGPWRQDDSRMGFGSRVWDAEGSRVCDVDNDLREPHENAANARLIAAAPDLLEAAKALV